MSWDRFETDELSICACGLGRVIKHSWQKEDDWNRGYNGVSGYEIECPNCKRAFHVDSITRQYESRPWKRDGISIEEYLVPNGLKLPKVMIHKNIQVNTADAEIVSKYSADTVKCVINDMNANKYSTRVQLRETKEIIKICSKRLHTQSLNRIVPFLQKVLIEYDTYEWNPLTVAEFEKKQQIQINENEEEISRVISKSFRLVFS